MVLQERLSKILLTIIKLGILLVLFLPLVVNSQFFFPFIVFKNVLFRILIEVLLAAYLILAQLNPQYRPKFNRLVWAVLAFFGVSVVAALFGLGWYSSIWGNYERMSGLFHHLHLVAYFFVLLNTIKVRRDWYIFFTFSIFVSTLMSFFAFAQWLEVPFLLASSGGQRLTGTLGNPTFLAAYLIFNIFFILYFWAKESRFALKTFAISFLITDAYFILAALLFKLAPTTDWGLLNFLKVPLLNEAISFPRLLIPFIILQVLIGLVWFFRSRPQVVRALLTILLLFELFIVFNTQTRGALIGLAVGAVFLAAVSLFIKRLPQGVKIGALLSLIVIVTASVALVAAKETHFVQSNGTLGRLASISLSDTTTESRLLTWQASWQGWVDSPKAFLIGYGPEHYYYAFNKYFPNKIFKDLGSQVWFDRAHNIIFDVGVTTGLVGLLIYLSILGFAVLALIQVYRRTGSFSASWLLITFLITYFLQNLFVFDTLNSEILFYLFLAFIVFLSYREIDAEETEPALRRPHYLYITAVVVIMLIGVLAVNVKTLQANHEIFLGLAGPTANQPSAVLNHLTTAIDQAVSGRYEARQQFSQYVEKFFTGGKTVNSDQLVAMTNLATVELEKSVAEEPLNVRHYLWAAAFYNVTSALGSDRPLRAHELLTTALPLSPTRQDIYSQIARSYLLIGEIDKTFEYIEKAIDLSPEIIHYHWELLIAAMITDREEIIDRELQVLIEMGWRPLSINYSFENLASSFVGKKQYNRALLLYERVLQEDPEDNNSAARHAAEAAALYAKVGENEKAKAAAERAMTLDPSFVAEGEIFLEQLERGELAEE